jgi:uncharacterized repeat protein (TIGR01451 family)
VALVIAPGGSVTFTITATVSTSFVSGNITNVATATPGTNTECADDPTLTECEAQDSFGLARLDVVKVRATAVPKPGGTVVYRVTVSNPSSVPGVGSFTDPLPTELDVAGATWTCTPSTGSVCGQPSGTGSPGVPTPVAITVAPGGNVAFTITATILSTAGPVTVHNVASVTPGTDTACVDGRPTCDGSDTFTATPTPATLSIAKTHQPPAPVQGQAVTYTVTVTNTSTNPGQATVANATVSDPFDSPALTGITWTATATAGSTVSPTAGAGSITGVQVTVATGGVVTFTVTATVRSDWPGGDVVNTSVLEPGANTECDPSTDPSCSATDTFPTPSLITIAKSQELTDPLPMPGQNVIYRVTVTNVSDQQDAHATINDPLPPQLNPATAVWATTTTGTGTTATPASGTGPVTGVAVTLAPEGTVTFTITATIFATFPGGTITNTATATPGENTACQNGDPTCDASTSIDPEPLPATLAIAKTANTGTEALRPGDHLNFTITVTNTSVTTTGTGTVTDASPPGLIPGDWMASASAGSTVSPSSGTGPVNAYVTVAPHGVVTFVRQAQIDPTFSGTFDIDNVAHLALGPNTNCVPSDPTQACDADAVVHVITAELAATEMPAPAAPVTGGELPLTGAMIGLWARAGLLLVLSGAVLLYASRRRGRGSEASG